MNQATRTNKPKQAGTVRAVRFLDSGYADNGPCPRTVTREMLRVACSCGVESEEIANESPRECYRCGADWEVAIEAASRQAVEL